MMGMLARMSGATLLYIILTGALWKWRERRKLTWGFKILIGVLYGIGSVLSTHFAIDYGNMLLNVRDIGPLAAGLFFAPSSGIIAGLIGGIERYIAGTYWNIGAYTRIACSVSTCLAGFVAAGMNIWIFREKKPSEAYAFFMGAVMEVFHMYVVFITHRSDMTMALHVVRICAPPMIVFTGIGLAVSAALLKYMDGEWKNPFRKIIREETPVSQRFQRWLFLVAFSVLLVNYLFMFMIQTQSAVQNARDTLEMVSEGFIRTTERARTAGRFETVNNVAEELIIGKEGTVDIADREGNIISGAHRGKKLPEGFAAYREQTEKAGTFVAKVFDVQVIGQMKQIGEGTFVICMLPSDEVYADRDAQAYESALAAILLFTVIYVLIFMLVEKIVVQNLVLVNQSLAKITGGDLNETVNVRASSEFASLSDDINKTVDSLKGYIDAAEKRIEQELEFARVIQDSALPKNFNFPRNDFDLYAIMNPAKEVGGDFYDFFFVDRNRLALVIADVSGKGIPAALFMMRAKTAIRSMAESGSQVAEILYRANNTLQEGNEAEMFVTAWIGIIDLNTGIMRCANAGHEYPAIKRSGGEFELFKDKHGLALAAMEGVRYKEYELEFKPGDQLFVYTDGLPEAINTKVEAYGTDRVISSLNAAGNVTMEELVHAAETDLSRFVGEADQFDDTTMLGFHYKGAEQL